MKGSAASAFIKDNGIIILGTIIVNLKALILMPIIIKTMGVGVYGAYVMLASMLSIMYSCSSLGVGITARRYLPSAIDMPARAKLFYPQFIFNLCMILGVAFTLWMLDQPLRTHVFKDDFGYSAFILPCYLVAYFLYGQICDYFRFTSRIDKFTLATTVYPYLHMSIILTLLYGFDVISIDILVISESLSAFSIALVGAYVMFKEIGFNWIFYEKKKLLTEIRLGIPLMLNVIVDFILAVSDRYLITFYLSVSAVGYYNPGYLLGSLMMFLPKATGVVLPQLMSKSLDSDDEQTAQIMLNYTMKLFLGLAIPFVFGSLVLAQIVLQLLTNDDVAEASYLITPLVAAGVLFFGMNHIITSILFVRLQTSLMFRVNVLAATFNLVANIILLHYFPNIIVAAVTTLLSYFISFIYVNHKLKAIWSIDYDLKFIIKVVICSVLMAIMVFISLNFLRGFSPMLILAVLVPSAIVVYVVSLILLKAFSEREISKMKGMIFRRLKSA